MTREEILVLLKEMKQNTINGAAYDDPKRERKFIALDEAIKELEKEPCEDAISREDAILALDKIFDSVPMELTTEILKLRTVLRKTLPSVQPKPIECEDAISREDALMCMTGEFSPCVLYNPEAIISKRIQRIKALPPVQPKIKVGHWIPVSERLPELNKPLLVTAYHRVCYAHMISESGNYGYPVFRLHEIKDSDRGWVQETISHEPYSKGRIDAWMYIDIPEPYKAESENQC